MTWWYLIPADRFQGQPKNPSSNFARHRKNQPCSDTEPTHEETQSLIDTTDEVQIEKMTRCTGLDNLWVWVYVRYRIPNSCFLEGVYIHTYYIYIYAFGVWFGGVTVSTFSGGVWIHRVHTYYYSWGLQTNILCSVQGDELVYEIAKLVPIT